jgi:hypothetical protein
VLYVSGYTDAAVVLSGVITSGTPFVQKPFTSQGILKAIRGVLDARSENTSGVAALPRG